MNEIKVLTLLLYGVCVRVCVKVSEGKKRQSDIMIRLQEVQFAVFSKWFKPCGWCGPQCVCVCVWVRLDTWELSQCLSETLIDGPDFFLSSTIRLSADTFPAGSRQSFFLLFFP